MRKCSFTFLPMIELLDIKIGVLAYFTAQFYKLMKTIANFREI